MKSNSMKYFLLSLSLLFIVSCNNETSDGSSEEYNDGIYCGQYNNYYIVLCESIE